MSAAFSFEQVGRLPAPEDNVAIAVRRLEAGWVIEHGRRHLTLPVTILEGHRFAIEPIAADSPLLSWVCLSALLCGQSRRGNIFATRRFCEFCGRGMLISQFLRRPIFGIIMFHS